MKKVVIGGLAGFVVLVVGVCSIVWGLARGVDHVVDHATDEVYGSRGSTSIELGAEFTHGDWKVSDGWSMTRDAYGRLELVGDVTNVGDSPRASYLTFKFLDGQRVLASTDCFTDRLEPGQLASMDCLGIDDFPTKYDAIQVTGMF
jgi:hypothetical protein